jgi:hypothetical protein
MYGGVEVYLHAFLTSVLGGGRLSASRPAALSQLQRAEVERPRAGTTIFWVKTPRSLVGGGRYCPHIQGISTEHTESSLEQQRFSLVFGRCPVRISARRPTILTAGFRWFPQYIQATAEIDLHLSHSRILSHPFRFIVNVRPVVLRYI